MAKIKIMEYKNLKCIAELKADGACAVCGKHFTLLFFPLKKAYSLIWRLLHLFFNGIRVREEICGNHGPKKKKKKAGNWESLLADFRYGERNLRGTEQDAAPWV